MNTTRILLADDHAVVRAGIHKVIEDSPNLLIVGEVEDGPSLLKRLEQTQPDCLLVDISMPEFNPLKTIPDIRTQYPDMKILVVSAYDDILYVQGLLEAGVDGYHLKDQPLSDLKLAINRIKAISGKTRIIMISAYPDREFHRLSIEAGAVAFLDKKDLDTPTLRQVIDDLL